MTEELEPLELQEVDKMMREEEEITLQHDDKQLYTFLYGRLYIRAVRNKMPMKEAKEYLGKVHHFSKPYPKIILKTFEKKKMIRVIKDGKGGMIEFLHKSYM